MNNFDLYKLPHLLEFIIKYKLFLLILIILINLNNLNQLK